MPATPHALRRTVLLFSGVLVVTLGVAVAAVAFGRDSKSATPEGTVRDFLVTAAVDQDGVDACDYLTGHAVAELAAVEPRDTSCEQALDAATLTLGRDALDTEAAVKTLSYREQSSGDRARVTVEADGVARTFTLRKVDTPPPAGMLSSTPWRIESGVTALTAAG
jgi:hypothetical protein